MWNMWKTHLTNPVICGKIMIKRVPATSGSLPLVKCKETPSLWKSGAVFLYVIKKLLLVATIVTNLVYKRDNSHNKRCEQDHVRKAYHMLSPPFSGSSRLPLCRHSCYSITYPVFFVNAISHITVGFFHFPPPETTNRSPFPCLPHFPA